MSRQSVRTGRRDDETTYATKHEHTLNGEMDDNVEEDVEGNGERGWVVPGVHDDGDGAQCREGDL